MGPAMRGANGWSGIVKRAVSSKAVVHGCSKTNWACRRVVAIACRLSGAAAEPAETQREDHKEYNLEAKCLDASKRVLHVLFKPLQQVTRPDGLPLLAE